MSELDRKRLEKAVDELGSAPPSAHLSVRLYPGYWVSRPLPDGDLSTEEIVDWARTIAAERNTSVILTTPDGGIVRISDTGRITGRVCGGVIRGKGSR